MKRYFVIEDTGESLTRINLANGITLLRISAIPSIFFHPKDRAEESDAARENIFVSKNEEYLFNQKFIGLALVNIPLSL